MDIKEYCFYQLLLSPDRQIGQVSRKMVRITNVVVLTDLDFQIDLTSFTNHTRDVPCKIHWSNMETHKFKIGENGLVLGNGKLYCNGNKSLVQAKRRVGRYARLIQKQGFLVVLKTIEVVTMSVVHRLSAPLDLGNVCELLSATFDPEVLNAAMLKGNEFSSNVFNLEPLSSRASETRESSMMSSIRPFWN